MPRKKEVKSPTKQSSLSQTMKELAEYNRMHNTYISYGQFVAMKSGEYRLPCMPRSKSRPSK